MALPSAHTLLSRAVGTVTQTPRELDADDPDTSGQPEAEGRSRRGAGSQLGEIVTERMLRPRICVMKETEKEGESKMCTCFTHGTYPSLHKICSIPSVGQAPWWVGTELSVKGDRQTHM